MYCFVLTRILTETKEEDMSQKNQKYDAFKTTSHLSFSILHSTMTFHLIVRPRCSQKFKVYDGSNGTTRIGALLVHRVNAIVA